MNKTFSKLARGYFYALPTRSFSSKTLAGGLSAQLEKNEHKNAFRFENQNKTWTFKEVNEHSNAFANGLLELGFKAGDRVLFWLDSSNTSEIAMAQAGLARLGVSIVTADIKDGKSLESSIKETDCKAVIFSPGTKIGDKKQIDVLKETFPSLSKNLPGAPLKLQGFPHLKYLIHTGFKNQDGCVKYRQVLVYGNSNFLTSKLPNPDEKHALFYSKQGGQYKATTQGDLHAKGEEFRKANQIGELDTIVVSGDFNSPAIYSYGPHNAFAHGNYVILSGNEAFKSFAGKLETQRANHVILNEPINERDLPEGLDVHGLKDLKNIHVGQTISVDKISHLFGDKKPSKIQANF
jgi:hypothetical protein